MNYKQSFHSLIHVGLVALVVLSGTRLSAEDPKPLPGAGPHNYDKFPGTATITSIEKANDLDPKVSGQATAGYKVWFTFKPTKPIENELGKQYLDKHPEHQLTLTNGWLPGPQFLDKYGIKKDATFPATLMTIVKGTTTPVILEIDGVDRADFFEANPK